MPQNIPAINSVWRRKDNHNKYTVRGIANLDYRGIHKKDFSSNSDLWYHIKDISYYFRELQ